MSRFVFVHGAFHGAWCWDAVADRVRAAGHEAIALDLPRGGADRTPIAEVTLASTAQRVTDALAGCDAPAVLVAHSAGGLSASMAIEADPERVARGVFVTAALLGDGEALLPTIGARDPDSWVLRDGTVLADEQTGELRLGEGRAAELFYNTCTPEQVASAEAQITQPIAALPLAEPVRLSAAGLGSVPLTYVRARQDRAFTAAFQQEMLTGWKVEDVRDLDTDHSPFLCAPDALAAILLDVA